MRWYSPWKIPNSAIAAFMEAEEDPDLERITWPSIGFWEELGAKEVAELIVLAGATGPETK